MRLLAIASVALLAFAAGTASAYDVKPLETPGHSPAADALLSCDNGASASAVYQSNLIFYGNGEFPLAAGDQVSLIQFEHFGFGWSGPTGTGYDFALWFFDDQTCTVLGDCPGFHAADAGPASVLEDFELCDCNFVAPANGEYAVLVQPLSCLASSPTQPDCYPDLLLDDAGSAITCDRTFDTATGQCAELFAPGDENPFNAGAFILRIELGCGVPVEPATWGAVKGSYR